MKKDILIIGGMGPQASLLLHKRIVDKAIERGAREGADFPAITHLSLPIEDFISDVRKTKSALRLIQERLGYLWRTSVHTHCHRM